LGITEVGLESPGNARGLVPLAVFKTVVPYPFRFGPNSPKETLMEKTKKIRKMKLARETLRRLEPLELQQVAGGATYGAANRIIETDTPSECFC
jgi:hypothetical protein